MKKMMLLEMINRMKRHSDFQKKLKYFLIFGIGGFLIFGGIAIYLSFSAINYVAGLGQNFNFNEATKNIPIISNVACLENAKSLMNIQVWIEKPAMDNILKLKQVCLQEKPTNNKGEII